jgi:hypothetical protein
LPDGQRENLPETESGASQSANYQFNNAKRDVMMKNLVLISVLTVLLISACSAAAPDQPASGEGDSTLVTVYRSPT